MVGRPFATMMVVFSDGDALAAMEVDSGGDPAVIDRDAVLRVKITQAEAAV
jgi:hypothetical protein